MKRHEIFDILGLGFGPSNIALAVAIEESGFDGSVLMFERRSCAQWFPDMLLPGSDIQNHPSRDLVTPRNPRSRYTFLNFLHEHGMLFEHLNLGIEFPLRTEYAKYISWVASFFSRWVRYDSNVTGISQVTNGAGEVYKLTLSDGSNYYGRALVVAPGRTPHIPAPFLEQLGPQVFHLSDYLSRLKAVEAVGPLRHVCVVGGSQSAAEIVLHLRQNYPNARITNIVRGYGYRLKDTSQFSERVYFPEFVDYYYQCDRQAKKRLNTFLRLTNYSAADGDVIQQLYTTLYEDKLCGHRQIDLYTNHEVLACNVEAGAVSMELCEVNTSQRSKLNGIDAVVLATGFKDLGTATGQERVPAILNDIASDLLLDEDGVLHVERDYRLLPRTHSNGLPPLYLNGLCESSHGLGDAGSFSLLSLRGADICRSLLNALQWEPASDVAAFEDASEPERALTQLGTA